MQCSLDNEFKHGADITMVTENNMQEDIALDDFEKSLEKLEGIVQKMEQGTLTLEQSLNAFEEGVQLTRSCQDNLRAAEQRVSKLLDNGDQSSEVPFTP